MFVGKLLHSLCFSFLISKVGGNGNDCLLKLLWRLSTDGCRHQFNTDRNPSLGCGEEGNFIQCKQLNCDPTKLWNSSVGYSSLMKQHRGGQHRMRQPLGDTPLWLDSSALLWPSLPALLCATLVCSALVCSALIWPSLVL